MKDSNSEVSYEVDTEIEKTSDAPSNSMPRARNNSISGSNGGVNVDNIGIASNNARSSNALNNSAALGNKGFKNRADLGNNEDAVNEDLANKAADNLKKKPNDPNNINNVGANPNSPNKNDKLPSASKGANPNGLEKKKDASNAPDANSGSSHRNPLPGANLGPKKPATSIPGQDSNDPTKKGNKKNGGGAADTAKKLFNKTPLGRKVSAAKQALGVGKGEGNSEGMDPAQIMSALPSLISTFAAPIVVISLVIVFAIVAVVVGVSTGTIVGAAIADNECDQPSYTVNSSNATEFLCGMSSPFGKVAEGHEYNVSSTSGKRIRPCAVCSDFHQGTDLAGMNGVSVGDLFAVADGVIDFVGPYGGYGNSVLIKHTGANATFYTRYGHLSSIESSLEKGKEIKAGDKLGVWGSTGNSTGVHLHFELLDENKKYLSANPFFGYSDLGYEGCLDPNSSISNSKCDYSNSGKARYIGQTGFAQICGKTGSYVYTSTSSSNSDVNKDNCCGTLTSSTTGGDIFTFIKTFEGTGERCTASDGSKGYVVYADKNANGKLTVGPGVTTDYISGITAGQCISETKVKEGYEKAEKSKRSMIKSKFADANLSQHQEDAMVSMAYNGCGTFFNDIAKAAKDDDLSGVWKAMKDCTNGLLGLQRRRKAEFALYVTGDYSEATAKSYKEKTWSSSDYDDYDSDGVLAKKTSGTSASKDTCEASKTVGGYSTTDIVKVAQKELENWGNLSTSQKADRIMNSYLPACGYGTKNKVDDYCAAFVSFVLQETGNLEKLGAGVGNKCIAPNWQKSTGGTFHKRGSSYTPKPGDLAVYSGHVEIVEKVEGKMVTAISGNSSPFNVSGGSNPGKIVGNVVRKAAYAVDSNVVGYLET